MTLKQWTSQHEMLQSVSTRQEALWMLISYSICDKTDLNELIYLQLPPDSLSSCLTDAFSNTSAGKGWWGGVGARCCRDAETQWWLVRLGGRGGGCGGGGGGVGGGRGGGWKQLSKTKQGRDRKQFKTLY